MVLVDLRVVLDFHELVLESSSLDEKKLSFIFDLFFRFFDFMLVLEVIFWDLVALILPFVNSLLKSFDACHKVIFLEVPLLDSDDLVFAIALDSLFEKILLLLFIEFQVFKFIFQIYDFIIWKQNCFHYTSSLGISLNADVWSCWFYWLICTIQGRDIAHVWFLALILNTFFHCFFFWT